MQAGIRRQLMNRELNLVYEKCIPLYSPIDYR